MVDLGIVAKVRPCFVLSIPSLDQDRALVTIVPHTTSLRGSRFEVSLRVRFLKAGAFDAQNLITIPEAKLLRKLGTLSASDIISIEEAVSFWLGLSLDTDETPN